MTASIGAAQVVGALKGALRWVGLSASRAFACLSGRALVTTADLALTQMGVPAALACCQYLAVRMAELLTSPDRPTEDPEPSV